YALVAGGTGAGSLSGNVLTVTHAGTFFLRASQAGDADWNAAPDADATLAVGKADQTISFPTPAPVPFSNGLTAHTAGDDPTTSGLAVTYAFVAGGTGAGSLSGDVLTVTHAGTLFLRASQAGDADYNAAPDADAILTVGKADQTVSFPTPAPVPFSPGL